MLALNVDNKLDAILIIPFISFLSQNAYHLRGCTEMRFIFSNRYVRGSYAMLREIRKNPEFICPT